MMSDQQAQYFIDKSTVGDLMTDLKASPQFKILKEHVLEPLQMSAFNAFKNTPADSTVNIIEAQMMSKMVDKIEQVIDAKIQEGINAKDQLAMAELEN